MPAVEPRLSLPDRYRVVRHIANGGMAAVWAAEDELLERLVAVKVLAPGFAADPGARRRFTREARAAARVSDHPNVVTIYDIGESEADPPEAFIVMEHFAGGTVAQRLKADAPLPVATALRWLSEAADALDAAHAADIVHRDVKPGNLLLDANGRLAVADFGIASIAGETSVTMTGQVLGTAAYLSPEQATGHAATPASDRYSLAVVAYEMLCGKRPFDGDTPVAQLRAHAEAEVPEPTGPCAAAAAVLRHGLEKDPSARPATAAAFVAALERALGSLAEPVRVEPTATTRVAGPPPAAPSGRRSRRSAGPVPPPAPPSRTPAPRAGAGAGPPRRRGFPAAVMAGLALLVVAAIALAATGGDGDKHSSTPTKSTAEARAKAPARKPAPAAAPEATAPSTAQTVGATALNNAGFAMLPGNPQGAIPVLAKAVESFRNSGQTSGRDYAYALYNLGWALRLGGRPQEAIPYLQERLRISDFKRGVVEKELQTAQQQAGVAPEGKRKGKKDKGDRDD
jgi:serine/threonine-protein kinase